MSKAGAIGLTGGIACGKSEVAGFLKQMNIPVLDTDLVAHALLEPEHWVFEKVVQTFGREYVHEEGMIDRRKLGAFVFANDTARAQLNAIMHPEIYREVDRWLESNLSSHPYAVAMIPLLFETEAESRFDKTVVVASDVEDVKKRLLARGLSMEESMARIGSQMPLEKKIERADSVIWNNGDLLQLKKETIRIWNKDILGKETET